MIIITKYHGPTNTRGARISARIETLTRYTKRVSVPFPYELSVFDAHAQAARALAERENLDLSQDFIVDSILGGYAFVSPAFAQRVNFKSNSVRDF
jgi:hypothetical protein